MEKQKKQKKKWTVYQRRECLKAYLMLSPMLIGFVIVSIGAILGAIALSFTDYSIAWPPKFIGLKNYIKLFTQPLLGKILLNSLYYVLLVTVPTVVLSLIFALLMDQKVRGGAFFRAAVFWPVIASMTAVSLIWMFLLNGNFGIINYLLGLVGIEGPQWLSDPKLTLPVFAFIYLWRHLGYYMTIMLGGLQGIPTELYESALLDGAGYFKRTLHVTLPLLSPTIFYVMIMVVIYGFQVFDQIMIISKDGGPAYSGLTLSFYIYQNAFANGQMGYASSAGVVLFLIVMAFSLLQFKLQKKWVYYN